MKALFDYTNWDKSYNLFKKEEIGSLFIASSVEEKKPDVIFTIPAYRRHTGIVKTIESIINQKTSYKFIIMVVDDSGEDCRVQETVKKLIKKYKNIILYKNEKNLG